MIREGLVIGFDYVVVCEGLVFRRFLLLCCGVIVELGTLFLVFDLRGLRLARGF
jgi:hypothetical protein